MIDACLPDDLFDGDTGTVQVDRLLAPLRCEGLELHLYDVTYYAR